MCVCARVCVYENLETRRKENKRIVPNKVIIEWRRSEKKRLAGLGERSVRRRWNQGSELIKK